LGKEQSQFDDFNFFYHKFLLMAMLHMKIKHTYSTQHEEVEMIMTDISKYFVLG